MIKYDSINGYMIGTFSMDNIVSLLFLFSTFIPLVILTNHDNAYLAYSLASSKPIYFIKYLSFVFIIFVTSYLMSRRNVYIRLTYIDICLSIIIIYLVANRYLFKDNISFSLQFYELIALCLFYLSIRLMISRFYYILVLFIAIGGVFQSIAGMQQISGHKSSNSDIFSLTGGFFNPGPYGGYLCMSLICCLGILTHKAHLLENFLPKKFAYIYIAKKIISYILISSSIFIFIFLIKSESKSSYISLVFGIIFLFQDRCIKIFKDRFKLTNYQSLLYVFGLLLLIYFLFFIYTYNSASSKRRILIWKISTNIISDNPLLGLGFDGFKKRYMEYQGEYFAGMYSDADAYISDNSMYAFNDILQFTVENGIFGLSLGICLMYVIIFFKYNSEYRDLRILCMSLLVSAFLFSLFSYPSQILDIKMVLVVALSILSSVSNYSININISIGRYVWCRSFLILFFLFGCTYTFLHIRSVEDAFEKWQNGLMSYSFEEYEKSVGQHREVYKILGNNGEFLMNYGKSLELSGNFKESIVVLERAKLFMNNTIIELALANSYKELNRWSDAEQSYQRAICMIPFRLYSHYLLERLYRDSGECEKSFDKALKILDMNAKVHSVAVDEIKHEMRVVVSAGRCN